MRVLVVLTSHARLGDTGIATGVGLETFASPYYVLREAGIQVDVASVRGGRPPIDHLSLGDDVATESTERLSKDRDAQAVLTNTAPLAEVEWANIDALVFAGGQGGMWDFADNPIIDRIITETLASGGLATAICHGVAALTGHDVVTGRSFVRGRRVTGLTNHEEQLLGRDKAVPFLLEERLRAIGADFAEAPPFTSHVVTDGPLITGQNMRSSEELAERLRDALHEYAMDEATG